jgi:hypothetical protein
MRLQGRLQRFEKFSINFSVTGCGLLQCAMFALTQISGRWYSRFEFTTMKI